MPFDAIADAEFTPMEDGTGAERELPPAEIQREALPEGPVVHLTCPVASYILWLACGDLKRWSDDRKTQYLTKAQATSFAMYLRELIPRDLRTEVPPL